MRHGKTHNHLGRKVGHRRSMLRNLAVSLIEHKRISTTLAKAKALRVFVEPIITTSKANDQHAHRQAFRMLQNKEAVKELFAGISPVIQERPGGYCRVIRTGTRLGDNAEMALIELVDFNETYNATEKKTGGRRRRRRSGSGSAKSAATNAGTPIDTTATDTPPGPGTLDAGERLVSEDPGVGEEIGDALVAESDDKVAFVPELEAIVGDSNPEALEDADPATDSDSDSNTDGDTNGNTDANGDKPA